MATSITSYNTLFSPFFRFFSIWSVSRPPSASSLWSDAFSSCFLGVVSQKLGENHLRSWNNNSARTIGKLLKDRRATKRKFQNCESYVKLQINFSTFFDRMDFYFENIQLISPDWFKIYSIFEWNFGPTTPKINCLII